MSDGGSTDETCKRARRLGAKAWSGRAARVTCSISLRGCAGTIMHAHGGAAAGDLIRARQGQADECGVAHVSRQHAAVPACRLPAPGGLPKCLPESSGAATFRVRQAATVRMCISNQHSEAGLPTKSYLSSAPRCGRWGCFESIQIDKDGWAMPALRAAVRLRTRLRHLPYGDQGIFVERTLFKCAVLSRLA